MRKVGIRELKNSLSEILRIVAAGERVLVTDHGRTVAEINPPSLVVPGFEELQVQPGFWEKVASGELLLAKERGHDYQVPVRLADVDSQKLLDELREE
ncbi:MAG: type II toxin-antitoxin system prevent-host-death family antitoxin [Candidatus Eremiobacteraeota bacterium]|nr:type II toxin-antitoxin system prevent-host-death family antitoxin [Candidatus Eremiobacteraeota bacterium]MCW5871686.1 type II toxin-antitoxin system prevent-host-death family antitoxin [Candidatus Eremiobacteraeota bacterium]